jgi:hypothetical protein
MEIKNMANFRQHSLGRKWTYLRQVVNNPNCPEYDPNLEVEGIEDFKYFAEWVEADIGSRPDKPNDILVRRNRKKGYVPGNIMWADARAKSYTVDQHPKITYKRKTRFIKDWARELDISYHVLYRRFNQGWTIPKIIKYAREHGYNYS